MWRGVWVIVAGGRSVRWEQEDYRGIGMMKTRLGTSLVEGVVGDSANRESEPRALLSQELGSGGVESDDTISETDPSANLMDSDTIREYADHENEECHVEEEEEDDRDEVSPQGCQEEDEGNNEPSSQKDSNGAVKLSRVLGVGI